MQKGNRRLNQVTPMPQQSGTVEVMMDTQKVQSREEEGPGQPLLVTHEDWELGSSTSPAQAAEKGTNKALSEKGD